MFRNTLTDVCGDVFAGVDQVKKLNHKLKLSGKAVEHQISDLSVLLKFLSPTLVVQNIDGSIIERFAVREHLISGEGALPAIDAIFMFGNNDLNQVEYIAALYGEMEVKPAAIYIAGLGGHGVTHAPIFAQTEAHTMQRRLIELGVDGKTIVIDPYSTNSGMNINNIDAVMAKGHQHILISGTPVSTLRQIRSYERQSCYDWLHISTLPPVFDDFHAGYCRSPLDLTINMFAALREMATFLNYAVNSEYMSERHVPCEKSLRQAMSVFVDYYSLLSRQAVDKQQVVNSFMAYSRTQAAAECAPEFSEQISAMAVYIRASFALVEKQWMKKLSAGLSVEQQSRHLLSATYARLGVDPVRKFNFKI